MSSAGNHLWSTVDVALESEVGKTLPDSGSCGRIVPMPVTVTGPIALFNLRRIAEVLFFLAFILDMKPILNS